MIFIYLEEEQFSVTAEFTHHIVRAGTREEAIRAALARLRELGNTGVMYQVLDCTRRPVEFGYLES